MPAGYLSTKINENKKSRFLHLHQLSSFTVHLPLKCTWKTAVLAFCIICCSSIPMITSYELSFTIWVCIQIGFASCQLRFVCRLGCIWLCTGLLVTRGSSFSTEDNVCFVSQNLSLVFTWLILGCIALSNHLCWLGFVALEWLHSLCCKIPQISPGTYIFQRPLFSRTYNQCKICILKSIKL